MMDRATKDTLDTKGRLLRAGEQLFRSQGYAGTGLKQLTQVAQAPWGSMYHFFPGGKEELGIEVMRYAAELYRAGLQGAFERFPDPAEAVARMFKGEIRVLEGSDYQNGCPVASVVMDIASTNESLRAACGDAFAVWLMAIQQGFIAAGSPEDEARALAGFVLSTLEGAIVLSRAAKSTAPLLQSAQFVRQVIAHAAQAWKAAPETD